MNARITTPAPARMARAIAEEAAGRPIGLDDFRIVGDPYTRGPGRYYTVRYVIHARGKLEDYSAQKALWLTDEEAAEFAEWAERREERAQKSMS